MVVYNGFDFKYNGFGIKSLTRKVLPQRTVDRRSITGGRGSRLRKVGTGERITTVTFHIKNAKSFEHLQEKLEVLSEVLCVDEPKKLEFSDKPYKFIWAIPEGDFTVEQSGRYAVVTVDFISIDPMYYDVHETTKVLKQSGALYCACNTESNWEAVISFTGGRKDVLLTLGDSVIELSGAYGSGDVITLDNKGKVTLNNTSSPHILTLTSRLKPLKPFNNDFSVPTGVAVEIKYRRNYL